MNLTGCYYDVEEELYPEAAICDTSNVTYSGTVLPILQNDCYSCHGNGTSLGGVSLDPYNNLKVYVDNGKLVCTINHNSGCSPMPQNSAQLDACQLLQIETWINNGALEN